MNIVAHLARWPWLWDRYQAVMGAPDFKRELYRSRLTPPGKLLDFGCATGHISDAFDSFDYYGLDLDPDAIAYAQRRFAGRPHMHFIAADLRDRPFPEDFFDEVLFACTAHHLDDDLFRSLLAELHFCLKPGGTIHLIDVVYQDKDGWSQKIMRRIDRGRFTRTAPQLLALIEALGRFDCGEPSFHPPRGMLLKDCDVMHLPIRKKTG